MVESKFIMSNNSTKVQLLRIIEMILYLGETMEFLPHDLNTKGIACCFHNSQVEFPGNY